MPPRKKKTEEKVEAKEPKVAKKAAPKPIFDILAELEERVKVVSPKTACAHDFLRGVTKLKRIACSNAIVKDA